MSVIVLGMEMPRDCPACSLSYWANHSTFLGCRAVPGKRYAMQEEQYRESDTSPDWCPLRPLPEKHGRLIDADDYAAEMKKRQDNAMLWKEKAARNNDMTTFARGDQAMRTFSEAKLTLDNMETIVEAEGD